MKICLIGTVATSNINFREDLIKHLVANKHDIFVFATDYTEKTKSAITDLGAHAISYSLSRGGLNPFADIKSMLELKKAIEKIKPDIVFSYFSKPIIFGTLAAKLAKIPRIVGMLEGLGYTFTPGDRSKKEKFKKSIIRFIQIFLYKISFRHLDRIIFLNQDDPVDLIEKYGINVKDIKILGGIGVNFEKFSYVPPPTDAVRFIFIARLIKEKGIHEFIDAARIVKKQSPASEFIVLGSIDSENPGGLSQNELNAILHEGIIIYPGHVDNVVEWIKKSSVFVLPSYREGVPRSTQEAMACGRAIITTDVPGCRPTVREGINGYLIPPHDARALAEKMLSLIAHQDRITLMGAASRNMAEECFDAQAQSVRLADFIGGSPSRLP